MAVGFVGAYTTFSTFEYETARLVEDGDFVRALLNVVLSVALGFAAVWAGILLARRVGRVPAAGHAAYRLFREQADSRDPAQSHGAEADIRDASIKWREKRG